jgi:hypothetical protein
MVNPVNGAIQTRPVAPGQFDPLEQLLKLLLQRSGIQLLSNDGNSDRAQTLPPP